MAAFSDNLCVAPLTRARLDRLDRLSRAFEVAVPGANLQFGVEAILRLVPGDVASALSSFPHYETVHLGVPIPVPKVPNPHGAARVLDLEMAIIPSFGD
jgi:hypothetical protein